jgi:hypothetical protein
MESKITLRGLIATSVCFWLFFVRPFVPVWGTEAADVKARQLSLRKAVGERAYKGRNVEGEERRIAPGDSLWRILIQEKGLPGKHFSRYCVVIRGLNPQLGPSGMLRVGDTLFVPLAADELLELDDGRPKVDTGAKTVTSKAATQDYRVQPGDNLSLILRRQLGIADERSLALYSALVKDLNPQKSNWNLLLESEMIRLPVSTKSPIARSVASAGGPRGTPPDTKGEVGRAAATAGKPSAQYPTQSAARDNIGLITRVLEALDNEVLRTGEEIMTVKDGTVRLERSSFPLLYNRRLNQRIILDADRKIPASIRLKLAAQPEAPAIFSLPSAMTVKEAVSELLSRLGFQSMSAEQPVVVHEAGLAFEVRGDWMALGPEEKNKRQEIFAVTLSDKPGPTPEYLRARLAVLGLHLKEVSLFSSGEPVFVPAGKPTEVISTPKQWPRDKTALVDAVLSAYGVRFSVSEALSVVLSEGVKLGTVSDRIFKVGDRRTAFFFRRLEPEIKEALKEKRLIKAVELDIGALSSHELITRVVAELGEEASYREHRFNAGNTTHADKLIVVAHGFLLAKPALFVTDREIPGGYHRFFFDTGLDIVYFR